MDHGGREFRIYLRLLIVLSLVALFGAVAHAEWDGPTTPEIEAWFRTVRNQRMDVCCDSSEVSRVEDYQWRGDHFDVVSDGVTYHVAPDLVSPDVSRIGVPVLWFFPRGVEKSDATVRCFLRGTEG